MKLLLDTHVIIWTLTDDPRLSPEARELISSRDNLVFFSADQRYSSRATRISEISII